MSALVVTFDQLPVSTLGCYGNEWIETPHFDRLAAHGVVADQCWAARLDATHADEAFQVSNVLRELAVRGVPTHLIRQDGSRLAFSKNEFSSVRTVNGELGPAAKPDRIPFAEMVRAAQKVAHSLRERGLLWLHARGLEIPADPPHGFADLYGDEFEDRGVKFDQLSDDEKRTHPATSAGMVSLLDHWLGQLLTSFAEEQCLQLTLVTAAQGVAWQPLPNSFGPLDALRSQFAHVPLVAHVRGEVLSSSGQRDGQLRSTSQLGELIAAWYREPSSWSLSRSAADRTATKAVCGERITTLDWSAIFPAQSDAKPLLFRKPEDYWEVNNLADVLPDIVEAIS
jgi:hypothetical protein